MTRVIGLMSGTSADGIDAVLCEISGTPPAVHASVTASWSVAFPAALQSRIHRVAGRDSSEVEQVCLLNADLGEAFARTELASLHNQARVLTRLYAEKAGTPLEHIYAE